MALQPNYVQSWAIGDQSGIASGAINVGQAVVVTGLQGNIPVVSPVSTAGGNATGIAEIACYEAGDVVSWTIIGLPVAQVGAAITTINAPLTTNASGLLVPATTGSGAQIFARAMQTCGSGEFIPVLITREGPA